MRSLGLRVEEKSNMTINSKPFLTVMIPVYNGADYVADAIRSVLNQPCRDLEVLVLDDGSTDDTLAICQRLAEEDSRVCVVTHTNVGLGANRNDGFAYVHGTWLVFLDHDDVMAPDIYSEPCMHALEICMQQGIEMIVNSRVRVDEQLHHPRFDALSLNGVFPQGSVQSWDIPYELATNWYSSNLIERNCIRFAETRPEMESIFRHQCAYLANKVLFCNKGFIEFRRENDAQITNNWDLVRVSAVRLANYAKLPQWHIDHGNDPVAVAKAYEIVDHCIRDFFIFSFERQLSWNQINNVLEDEHVSFKELMAQNISSESKKYLAAFENHETSKLKLLVLLYRIKNRIACFTKDKKGMNSQISLSDEEILNSINEYPELIHLELGTNQVVDDLN